jgi:hypothetical protein
VTDRLPALLASITGQRPTPAPPDADS